MSALCGPLRQWRCNELRDSILYTAWRDDTHGDARMRGTGRSTRRCAETVCYPVRLGEAAHRHPIASGSRCVTATRLPTRRVVGCGGVAFGCTSWPAFCLAVGASLPQCSQAGEGPPLVPGTYPVPVD